MKIVLVSIISIIIIILFVIFLTPKYESYLSPPKIVHLVLYSESDDYFNPSIPIATLPLSLRKKFSKIYSKKIFIGDDDTIYSNDNQDDINIINYMQNNNNSDEYFSDYYI